ATWLFMYGLIPIMQGPIAVALGGWDLSWLAGGLTSAGVYAILGPRQHIRYLALEPRTTQQAEAAPDAAAAPEAESKGAESTPVLPAL
ncbi:MAG: cytosine permease, partial [Arthrobacter sp.]